MKNGNDKIDNKKQSRYHPPSAFLRNVNFSLQTMSKVVTINIPEALIENNSSNLYLTIALFE